MEAPWTDAVALEELPEGRPVGVRVGTTAVVLVRRGDDVRACEAVCPHKFADLREGAVVDGLLHCPQHDAAFDPESGTPRAGDEWAGRLRVFPVEVRDGRVLVST